MASKQATAKPPTVVPTDTELEELGKSLEPKEVPAKLRCGNCDLVAYNAIRIPCCSTNVCESCFKNELAEETEECFFCHHAPLDKSICTPNKSMRTTIRALLKRKFELRQKRQAIEVAEVAKEEEKIMPIEAKASEEASGNNDDGRMEESINEERSITVEEATAQPMEKSASAVSAKSQDVDRAESTAPHEGNDQNPEQKIAAGTEEYRGNVTDQAEGGNPETAQGGDTQQKNQWSATSPMNQGFMNPNLGANGLNGMSGMFPMDMNSMMANSMMSMGGFPNMMAGMGMGMMPQMMPQMFGGFDGSNMGMNMNGMNMGMPFNNANQFGGNWMHGQDSYNTGYGNGGFGGQGGYNMSGNYNMNDQSYQNNDFQRGYGRQGYQNRRGRRGYYNGGYGRNSYNQSQHGNQYGYGSQNAGMSQMYPPQPSDGKSTSEDVGNTTDEQPAQGLSAEEAEAAMMKELAPGGQHDFDEELGRTDADDKTSKNNSESTENADTSISSDSKETVPTEATADDEVSKADDTSLAKAGADDQPVPENLVLPEGQHDTTGSRAPSEDDATRGQEAKDLEQDANGADNDTDAAPQPIQTFISDEPRSRSVMPPPVATNFVASNNFRSPDTPAYSSHGQTPAGASQQSDPAPTEPKGLGVVGAPTGPRALRQGHSNSGRGAWEPPNRSSISESDWHDDRRRSRSRSPIHNEPESYSRSRSRSPVRHHSEHTRIKRHRSPSEASDARRERWEERREEKREERRHRRSHRHYEDEDYHDSDAKRSSHRSHRRHDQDAVRSDRHRHRDRSRSRSPEREREKRRHRDEDYEEERRRRKKRARSQETSIAPTPSTPYAPEPVNGYEEHSSRKRRTRDYEEDMEQGKQEKKRSRRESSPGYDRAHERYPNSYENSKPATPITPSFAGPRAASHGSITANDTSYAAAPVIKKPIPTGPRAAQQQAKGEHRGAERGRDRDRDRGGEQDATTAPAVKSEKDIHTLEREARDRERLQREMQRRAFGAPKRKASGSNMQPSRRVSYKYEDENGLDARRIEQEREAGRWS